MRLSSDRVGSRIRPKPLILSGPPDGSPLRNGFKIGTASKGAFENIAFNNSIIYADSASPINTHPISLYQH
jgi:hypothetical protein